MDYRDLGSPYAAGDEWIVIWSHKPYNGNRIQNRWNTTFTQPGELHPGCFES